MSNGNAGLIQLMSFMASHFNSGDLKDLCFRLGVDYEDIPGPGKQAKIRELIQYMGRHSRTCDLVNAIGKARPLVVEDLNKIAAQLGCPAIKVTAVTPDTSTQQTGQSSTPKPPSPQLNVNLRITNHTGRPLPPPSPLSCKPSSPTTAASPFAPSLAAA